MKGALNILWAVVSAGVATSAASAGIMAGTASLWADSPADAGAWAPHARSEPVTRDSRFLADADRSLIGLVATLTMNPSDRVETRTLPEMPLAFEVLGSPLTGSDGDAPAMLRVGVGENEKVGWPFADAERSQSAGLARFIPTPGGAGLICGLILPVAARRRPGIR